MESKKDRGAGSKWFRYGFASLIAFVVGAGTVYGIYIFRPAEKEGIIRTAALFEGFSGKKDLEAKLEKIRTIRNGQLDSMKVAMEKATLDGPDLKKARRAYANSVASFEQEEQRLSQTYTDNIWKRLNGYVKEYGEEKGYRFIFGTQGSGNLMYARTEDDITDQVLEYANGKYEGDL
ncbi:hypothetical protein FUAX_53040 (plasmid) [Fulvitalea axinellae]|uniref:OmpH family outer membrane protein n=1 Tax=Fulvitalea axinellae TaxID=1182444 RepID=A0AAU9D148_9BACT|nr:hypothetical protein FUAX_53040 [Fulvitalea axinellae]